MGTKPIHKHFEKKRSFTASMTIYFWDSVDGFAGMYEDEACQTSAKSG